MTVSELWNQLYAYKGETDETIKDAWLVIYAYFFCLKWID